MSLMLDLKWLITSLAKIGSFPKSQRFSGGLRLKVTVQGYHSGLLCSHGEIRFSQRSSQERDLPSHESALATSQMDLH